MFKNKLIALLSIPFLIIALVSCKSKTTTTVKTTEGEATTTITQEANSIELRDATLEYFVGDSFDRSKGIVDISEKGKKTTLPLTSSKIRISGFDSTTKGSKEVEIIYGEIKTTITVNVYEIESFTFKGDVKKDYYNYDKTISIEGLKLELIGNSGNFKKEVQITEDDLTVHGFDPSAVFKENESKEQKLTITYKGVSSELTITMKYSELSEIKKLIDELSTLQYTSSSVFLDSDIEKAKTAYSMYEALTDSKKAELDDLEVSYIVRTMAVGISRKWDSFLEKYEYAFNQEFDGKNYNIGFVLPETLKEMEDYIKDIEEDLEFKAFLDSVDEIKYARSANILKYRLDSVTVESFLSRVNNSFDFFKELNAPKIVIEVYGLLKDVPEETELDSKNDSVVKNAIDKVIEYYDDGYGDVLGNVRKYRNDYYETFYKYYLAKENLDNENVLKIERIALPLGLEEAYYKIRTAVMMQYYFNNGQSLGESVNFMTLYLDAISSTGEEIIKDGYEKYVYRTFRFDDGSTFYDAIRELRFGNGGYNTLTGMGYIDQNFATLWEKYLALYEPYFHGNSSEDGIKYLPFENEFERVDDKEFDKAKYKEDVEEFIQFYSLMPISTRLPFMNSITMYSNGSASFFTTLLTEYFKSVFNKAEFDTFYYIFLSEQYDISRFESAAARSNFIKFMGEALRLFDELTETEQENIKTRTGALYENMKFMYDNTDKTTHEFAPTYEIGAEWQKAFDELETEIKRFLWLRQQNNISNDKYFGALLATYQRIYNFNYQITRSDQQAVRLAYMYLPLEMNSVQKLPLSYQVLTVTQTYVNLIYKEYSDNLTYSEILEGAEGFTLFLYKASFIMEYDYVKEAEITKEDFESIMTAFQELSSYNKYLLTFVFDPVASGMNEYYSGVAEYVYRALPLEDEDNLSTLLTYLISSEINYTQYLNLSEGEYKDNYRNIFKNYFEKAMDAYNKSTAEAKAVIDVIYQYYLNIYNELNK